MVVGRNVWFRCKYCDLEFHQSELKHICFEYLMLESKYAQMYSTKFFSSLKMKFAEAARLMKIEFE